MSINYTPITHFFADPISLANSLTANYATDAFGPIDTSSYRTTSKVRSLTETTVTKVYAICAGRILIQPQTGDNTRINLILKPEGSICAPLKIKYFIYRGVRKSDWIDVNNLKPKNLADLDQSTVLQRLWDEYIERLKTSGGEVPIVFPAALIGYDNDPLKQKSDTIDHAFNFIPPGISPTCTEGEFIGNFSGSLGLDIVLDDGDYQLQNQEEIFKFDLAFARDVEHIFDITKILAVIPANSSIDAVNIKRYKEYIHRFIDAAAFWGSHIECGTIKLPNNAKGLKTSSDIFAAILTKYQTKNKVYVYVKGKRDRSYSYFDVAGAERQIKGFNGEIGEKYNISNWPILIKEVGTSNIEIGLEYSIDQQIKEVTDRYVTIDIIAPDNDTKIYPLSQNIRYLYPAPPAGTNIVIGEIIPKIPIKLQMNDSKSCASFLFIFGALDQDFPLANYFDDLWLANMNTNQSLPGDSTDLLYWSTCNKNRILNISGILNTSAAVQNQTFFDTGINNSALTKKRRLSIAILKETSNHSALKKLKSNNLTVGISNEKATVSLYSKNLYNDEKMSIYRGRIIDGSNVVYTLSLAHEEDFMQKMKYFHLGITEEEYNELIYDIAIPLPSSTQIFSKYANNVFFHLEEDKSITGVYYRKFKVGLKYENEFGNIVVYFPPRSLVYVYTVDGFYFFSQDYSAYQNFYKEFSNCSVGFRPKSVKNVTADSWIGEFGFDWVRVGDTNLPVDPIPPGDYLSKLGHYYNNGLKISPDSNPNKLVLTFQQETSEWLKFSAGFPTYAKGDSIYPSASLAIYPSKDVNGSPTGFPKNNLTGSKRCLTEAGIDLIINIPAAPGKLQLKFETVFFEIVPVISNDLLPVVIKDGYSYLEIVNKTVTRSGPRVLKIILRSLNEFTTNKTIKILADDKFAGELVVLPNEKQFRKVAKVTLVSLLTQIDNRPAVNSLPFSGDVYKIIEEKISRLFNQALIDIVEFKTDILDVTKEINLSPGVVFNFNTSYVDNYGKGRARLNPDKTTSSSIQQNLYDAYFAINSTLVETLKDHFFIFYINKPVRRVESGIESFLNGAALKGVNSKIVCVYQTGIMVHSAPKVVNDTSGHELLHAAGLEHTFSNSNGFTFEKFSVDNIMEYSEDTAVVTRYTLSTYQKSIIEKHSAIKPEPI